MENVAASASNALDRWMDRATRLDIEARYWEPIESTGSLETLLADPKFESAPDRHISLFADHSGIHARDVASRVLTLLDERNGSLFEQRDDDRLGFMKTLGVWLAYLHDVGMVDARPEGRKMHAQFASQLVFRREFDAIVEPIATNGVLADRLRQTFGTEASTVSLRLRELLSMALCHSKSAIAAEVLGDLPTLRSAMTVAVLVDIEAQRQQWQATHWSDAPLTNPSGHEKRYSDAHVTPFEWLDSPGQAEQTLVADALDTVRILRVADALRQRGTDLRTSAGFEVFVDDTGDAVFHLASAAGDVSVQLRLDNPISVGEANITSALIEPSGDLRVVLHRGAFPAAARDQVANATARVIVDIALDVLDVFPLAPDAVIKIERCRDDASFATEVQSQVAEQSAFGSRTIVVASLAASDEVERARYEAAAAVAWPSPQADKIWAALGSTGFRTEAVDADRCFRDVRLAALAPGDVVIGEGQPATFVYVPTQPGLELRPGAGFASQPLASWRHVGATAVLRRGVRNSTIVATRALDVLMIPGDLYVDEWFRPFEIADIETIRSLVSRSSV